MRRGVQKLVTLACVAVLFTPATQGFVSASDASSDNPIKDCLAQMSEPRLAVQFLIDESKSLQTTDPLDRRVDAINSSIATLTFNFENVDESSDKNIAIDIRLAGFAKIFQDHGSDWISLSENDNEVIYSEVERFRKRNIEGYTNYQAGLEGAERSFVDYDRSRAGEVACKALVWLTDGNLDLDNSSANQGPEDRQIKELCNSGGVVDRLRSQQVFVIGLGLNSSSAKKQDFTLMSQMLKGGCGEREPYGTFSEVESADDLIREIFRNLVSGNPNELVPCEGEEENDNCREVRFTVRPPLSRINVLVGLTKEIDSATVINPKNESVSFAQDGKALTIQDGRVRSQPSFELSTILKIDVQELSGQWRLQFRGVGANDALVMSVFFSDVIVEIEDLPLRIDRREPQPVMISLGNLGLEGLDDVDAPGTVTDFDSSVTVVADLVLGSVLVRGIVSKSPSALGQFSIEFDTDQLANAPSNGVLTLTPVAVLEGQEINFTSRTESVALVLGDGFPTVKAVSATDIDSDGKSKVAITFDGPEEGTGSVRILSDQFAALEVPAGYELDEVAMGPINESIVSLESGQERVVDFVVDPAFKANGRVKGEIFIEFKNSFGDTQTQSVAFGFNMTKPFDAERFFWALLIMLISFLVVQAAILFFAVDRFSRITKVPAETYYARFRARVTDGGLIEPLHPSTWMDVFRLTTHPVMGSVSGKRRHGFGEFNVYGTRSSGLRWLFAGGDSTLRVSWPANIVVGSRSQKTPSDSDGRISPQLAGEWAIAVSQTGAIELAEAMEKSDDASASYIDHLTGETREVVHDSSIDVDCLYFVADFDGERAGELIEEMVMHLSMEPMREMIAAWVQQNKPASSTHPDSPEIPSEGGTPGRSAGSSLSIEDEYG